MFAYSSIRAGYVIWQYNDKDANELQKLKQDKIREVRQYNLEQMSQAAIKFFDIENSTDLYERVRALFNQLHRERDTNSSNGSEKYLELDDIRKLWIQLGNPLF
jgi:GTPase SAR1 family protein